MEAQRPLICNTQTKPSLRKWPELPRCHLNTLHKEINRRNEELNGENSELKKVNNDLRSEIQYLKAQIGAKKRCLFCQKNHNSQHCQKYHGPERLLQTRKRRLFYNCYRVTQMNFVFYQVGVYNALNNTTTLYINLF